MYNATTHSTQRTNGGDTSIRAGAPLVDWKLQRAIAPAVARRVAAARASVSSSTFQPVEGKKACALPCSRRCCVGDNATACLHRCSSGNRKLLADDRNKAA